jgi:hypothetical protein
MINLATIGKEQFNLTLKFMLKQWKTRDGTMGLVLYPLEPLEDGEKAAFFYLTNTVMGGKNER